MAVPGSDYGFYKLNWTGQKYFPITQRWTLRTRADVAYGDGYGDDTVCCRSSRNYSGGIGSVRGYESRSLGPRSEGLSYFLNGTTDPSPDPIGGNFLTEASMELIFPTPFAPESRSVRTFLFVDAGNVFETERDDIFADFEAQDIRTSAGIGLTWLTAIGPLSFNLAKALNDQSGDDTEVFQFSWDRLFRSLIMMKKTLVALTLLLPALAMADGTIGVLDPIAALQSSDNVKAKMSSLENELSADEQKLNSLQSDVQKLQQKLQKEAMTMSADQQETLKTQGQQKMIEIQSLQRKLQKRANEAQREILEEMQPKLKTAMEAVAKREKLDVVLNAQAVMYTKPDLDITEAVGKQLNSMK